MVLLPLSSVTEMVGWSASWCISMAVSDTSLSRNPSAMATALTVCPFCVMLNGSVYGVLSVVGVLPSVV